MRALLAILLIALVLVQPLSKVAVIVRFQFQREYIAKNLCVNRFNPSAKCDGKCYLAKKLRQEAGQESPLPGFAKEKTEITYFFVAATTAPDFSPVAERHDGGLPICLALPLRRGVDVFHPPSAGTV